MRYIHGSFAFVGGIIGWFLGGFDGFLYALVVFVCIDYVTGIMAAGVEKNISSAIGLQGICRKVLIFFMVGLGNVADLFLVGTGNPIRVAVIFFYLSNEGISILENAGRVGLPIPSKLRSVLEQLKE